MAAGGFRTFIPGEVLDEDKINDFLMQGILVFADATARDAAITAPVEGQFVFLTGTDELQFFDGTDFVEFSTDPGPAVVSATTGSPTETTITDGGVTFDVYQFTGSGSITFDKAGFAELLVIGAGGGGGRGAGAGGGAGGYLPVASAYFSAATHTVTVGAGGAGGIPQSNEGVPGNNGNSSRIGDFYAPGGGGGGSNTRNTINEIYAYDGRNGGSGGGSGGFTDGSARAGGLGFSPLGNNGGVSTASASNSGGGGGGASAVGGNTSTATGGAGGVGTASSITGSSVTRAGGGGGGGNPGGAGGTGGGGAGSTGTAATSGTVNTGGGGGGAQTSSGASGGSGIVIVRVVV